MEDLWRAASWILNEHCQGCRGAWQLTASLMRSRFGCHLITTHTSRAFLSSPLLSSGLINSSFFLRFRSRGAGRARTRISRDSTVPPSHHQSRYIVTGFWQKAATRIPWPPWERGCWPVIPRRFFSMASWISLRMSKYGIISNRPWTIRKRDHRFSLPSFCIVAGHGNLSRRARASRCHGSLPLMILDIQRGINHCLCLSRAFCHRRTRCRAPFRLLLFHRAQFACCSPLSFPPSFLRSLSSLISRSSTVHRFPTFLKRSTLCLYLR